MRARDEAGSRARQLGAKVEHGKGLWSAGPNEEWGGDGHLKLLEEMGISIWGLVDKASRKELGLCVIPGDLNANVTLMLYLLTVKKQQGAYFILLSQLFFTNYWQAYQFNCSPTWVPRREKSRLFIQRFGRHDSTLQ
jgi:hypothetical protein